MEISSQELKEKIKSGNKVLVDFYGTWCGPCKVMKPMFEKASQTSKDSGSDVEFYTFNIDSDRDFVAELGLRSVPTIKGFSKGSEVISEVGMKQTNAILEMADRLN